MSKIYGKNLLCLFFLAFLPLCAWAQNPLKLRVTAEAGKENVLHKYKLPKTVADSLEARKTVKEVVTALHYDGYVLALMERMTVQEEAVVVQVSIGERFEWLRLDPGNLDKALIRRAGYRQRDFTDKPFRYKQVARLQESLLAHAEAHGYPFASLTIDSLYIDGNYIGGKLNFDPGPSITFDSLSIKSDFPIRQRFLQNHLDIKQGELYDQKRVERLVRALGRLPYLTVASAPSITFQNSEATINLDLAKKRINQIDGIIGFLPNANASENDNRLLVTGQFDLQLFNPFGSGKKIGLHWRRQNIETQTLFIEYDHPNFFRSPLSVSVDFDFLKQGREFTKRDLQLSLRYQVGGQGTFTVFTRQQGTDLIETEDLQQATVLPDIIDFDLALYGVGFSWNTLDDVFLPKRGMRVDLTASAGNKKIRPNPDIPNDLLIGLDFKNLQYDLSFHFENYQRLDRNLILLNRIEGGLQLNDQLFRNDAIRLGGLNSLRGFNENFFFATRYAMTTLEGRLFFDEFSFLSLFGDFAVLRETFSEMPKTDFPIGLGAGISFTTNAGIFNFVYAVGRSDASGGLSLNQSKIHFGFTSRF